MKRLIAWAALLLSALAIGPAFAAPSVYPTGTTIYDPAKAWSGFTVLSILDTKAVIVIDMNGNVVKRWDDFDVSAGGPARILPGGVVIAPTGAFPMHQESTALVARDFGGKELWRFDSAEEITLDGKPQMSARQHHDWQLWDFPAGYYSPSFTPSAGPGRRLVLTHTSRKLPEIAGFTLEDDRLIELDASGKVTWEWRVGDHIDEFALDAAMRDAISKGATRDGYDWFHMNSATYLGPNKWFDAGDKRFDPQNVIISSRQASIVAIVARDGRIVWQLGPDFTRDPLQAKIRQIIGQHHAHLIPPGLPGAGNLLVFDNGGASGYGDPSPIAPNGQGIYARATSRVLEIDPETLEVVWNYAAPNFFSTNISGAQRLPNGNTLVTEGAPGRVFEVTPEKEIVWEYMNAPGEGRGLNAVYRAYRLPYGWLPQIAAPVEKAVPRPKLGSFHVPAD